MLSLASTTGRAWVERACAHLRHAALNRALDAIVGRFGMESIGRGGAGRSEKGLTTRLKRGE